MNTGRGGNRGNRRNRGGGSQNQEPYTPVSGGIRRGQVPRVPEENSAPGGNQGSQPPSGPRGHSPQRGFTGHPPSGPGAIQPGEFGGDSSASGSGSRVGQFTNEPRVIQPSGGSWGGSSAGSSRGYGGQPPYEPRANPNRGGPRGGISRGGTRGGSREPLGKDVYTDGHPIFEPPGEQAAPEPDPEVTAKEDENASSSECTFAKASGQDLDLPLRPSYSKIPEGKYKGEDHFVLRTNYLSVTLDLEKEFFRYDVTIEPASKKAPVLKNIRKRRQVYNILFVGERDFQVLGAGVATDYAETLITCGRLYEQSLPHKRYEVVYRNELEGPRDDAEGTQSDERKYWVTVTYSGTVPIPELIRYIGSRPDDPSNFDARLEAIQAMNIIVAGGPNKNDTVFQAGQNKFFQYPRGDPENPTQLNDNFYLGNGLIAVRGYYSSIRALTSRVLLNLNAQCSAFYPEITLLGLMYRFAGGPPIPDQKLSELEAFIRRLRVSTVQITGERKKITRQKTVWGFSHKYGQVVRDKKLIFNKDKTPKMTGTKGAFVDYGGSDSIEFLSDIVSPPRSMSVSEYFSKQYKLRLKSPREPVVNCGTDERPEWIPPERLTVMPGQPYRGTLSDFQTTNMLTIAARGPAENARRITNDGVQVIGIQPQSATLGAFGISITPEMLTVHGRQLSAPRIQYRQPRMPDHAEWNLLGNHFHEQASMPRWAVLYLGQDKLPNSATRKFKEILEACGMKFTKPVESYHANLPRDSDDDVNDNAITTEMDKVVKAQIPILLVVLNTKSAATYARVKYWGDTTYGIHTVCVLEKKLLDYEKAYIEQKPRGDGAYWGNVLHKFNLKLGGINHRLESGLTDMPQKTMVVGIDVAHPAPGSMENAPSVVAMVASKNNTCVHFPGSVRVQESRQEIQKLRRDRLENKLEGPPDGQEDVVEESNVTDLLQERLDLYRRSNGGTFPENILIYRDGKVDAPDCRFKLTWWPLPGVSESQYQAVLDLELKPIQVHCEKMYHSQKSAPPKITIIIVGKRHHTRFYPTNDAHADLKHGKGELCNPLNGTVVDRGITMHKGWDFYLQAHSAIKGTAKPAHYVVIHNDIGLRAAQVEKITHNLSYLYQRATKAVSYCTPAYYADLLCARGRAWLMKAVRRKDSETKFDFSNKSNPAMTAHFSIRDSMFYV